MDLSIWLDTYDDLYSDFDSKRFSKRLVSEDFLHELKRNVKEVKGTISLLILHLPAEVRKPVAEREILQSLRSYFENQHAFLKTEVSRLFRKGIVMTFTGVLLLTIAAYVNFLAAKSFPYSVVEVILEPAGWFLIWNGLDTIFYETRIRRSGIGFFGRMLGCRIQFDSSN